MNLSSDSSPTILPVANQSLNGTPCYPHDVLLETWFTFGTLHLVRVLITWILFGLSLTGNSFVLWSLRGDRSRYFIMFHLALSNIIYTVFVMPSDAVWNTTMEWLAGDAVCRITQMMKQFGMYSSSFMVVVIGTDRVTGILCPISVENQRRRGLVMVTLAWTTSFISCIPAGVIFSVISIPTCEGIPIHQCVDFNLVDRQYLMPYYFFTMCMSFVLPLVCTLVSYSLIVCEITNMKERDRVLMGRRHSASAAPIQRAKNKTILMRTLITLTFLLCWGPYYGNGIYDWFLHHEQHEPPVALDTAMYIAMYFNPVLHPVVFGIFMKEVRENFYISFSCLRKRFLRTRPRRMSSASRGSFSSYATGTTLLATNNNRLSPTLLYSSNKPLWDSAVATSNL